MDYSDSERANEKEDFDIVKFFLYAAALALMIVLLVPAFEKALKKEEKRECLQLQKLSQELRSDLFFLTLEQKKQCNAHGVKINAPVKGGGG